jgi:hypothetical protein
MVLFLKKQHGGRLRVQKSVSAKEKKLKNVILQYRIRNLFYFYFGQTALTADAKQSMSGEKLKKQKISARSGR